MQVLESDVEQKCRVYAEKVGVILLKIQGRKGWPDRVALYKGQAMFIEFKRPGASPSPLQQHWINELTLRGFVSTWITSLESFKSHLGALMGIKIEE